jgi:hypothetical protein
MQWAGTPRLRTTSKAPFFVVKHTLRVTVALSYGEPEDGIRNSPTSTLFFTLPLTFARFRPAPRSLFPAPLSPPEQSPSSGAPVLPAYSQLYYPNGDLRHDDSIPLPLYTPSAALLP